MAEHDGSYKQIFSHASMVEDLLRGFVQEDWVAELDFESLEKLNGSYVSEYLRNRSVPQLDCQANTIRCPKSSGWKMSKTYQKAFVPFCRACSNTWPHRNTPACGVRCSSGYGG
jgi:hypothetical protein